MTAVVATQTAPAPSAPFAAYAVALVISLTEGVLLPSIAYRLATWGVEPWLIGVNAAMPAAGLLLSSLLIPQLVQRLGLAKLLLAAMIASVILCSSYVLLPVFWLWFPLRFMNGMMMGTLYSGTEIWVNLQAQPHNRGRQLAILGSLLATGFSLGTLLLAAMEQGWIAGADWRIGTPPTFYLCSAALLLVLIPLLASWRTIPHAALSGADRTRASMRDWSALSFAPALFIAPFLFGGIEDSLLVLMPKSIVELGLPAVTIAYTAAALAAGNILIEIPLGWASDRFGRYPIILCSVWLIVASLALIWFGLYHLHWLYIGCFVLGGAIAGMYSVSLAALGDRFTGEALITANARFITVFGLGAFLLTPLCGLLMGFWNETGLMLMLLATSSISLLLVVLIWRRQSPSGASP